MRDSGDIEKVAKIRMYYLIRAGFSLEEIMEMSEDTFNDFSVIDICCREKEMENR